MLKSTIAFMAIGAMQELTAREAIAKAKGEKAPLDVRGIPQSELIGQVIEHADALAPFLAWACDNDRINCVWDYEIAEHLGQCVASLILDGEPVNILDLLRVRLEQTGDGLIVGWKECPVLIPQKPALFAVNYIAPLHYPATVLRELHELTDFEYKCLTPLKVGETYRGDYVLIVRVQ